MAAKRMLATFALAALLGSTGCRSWCERHYPCSAPVANGCAPCGPPATCYSAPQPAWNAPGPVAAPMAAPVMAPRTCTCTCQ